MVTLLFALFLVLFSTSQKGLPIQPLLGAVSDRLSGSTSNPSSPAPVQPDAAEPATEMPLASPEPTPWPIMGPPVPSPETPLPSPEKEMAPVPTLGPQQQLRDRLKSVLGGAWEGMAQVRLEERGVVVALVDAPLLFDSGSCHLRPQGSMLIGEIIRVAQPFASPIRVEGHTDDVPVGNSGYRSNWELSVLRAAAVGETLLQAGVEPDRLSVMGYGQYHPRVPNRDPHSRALNRRVEIVFMSQ